jgi:uncharacterized membrane protein YoaK (UPF0700 family)
MIGYRKRQIALAMILAAVAGFVDGVGYLQLGGPFVSFMSGNSTRSSVSLAQGHWHDAAQALAIIAGFVLGAVLGALIGRGGDPNRRRLILLTVGLLLVAAALAHLADQPTLSIGAMVLAMGIVNAVFQKDGETGIGVTYMTGALVRVGHRIAAALRGGPPLAWTSSLFLWVSLCCGALCGALAFGWVGLGGLWIPGIVVLVLAWSVPPTRRTAASEASSG